MTVVFIVLWSVSGPIQLEPIEGRLFSNIGCWIPGMVSVETEGSLFVGTREDEYWLFDLKTGSATPVRSQEFWVRSVAGRDGILYMSGFRDDIAITKMVDHSGKVLAERSGVFSVLRFLGEDLVGTNYAEWSDPIVHVMSPETLETRESFFQTPEVVRESQLFASSVWVTRRNGVYILMDGVFDRIYFGTKDRLRWENERSNLVPNTYPFKELGLPNYTRPSLKAMRQPMVREEILGILDFYNWRFRLSYALYFHEVGDGYVFCYEIPDRIGDTYIGNHLAIQFLDAAFRPVGLPLERYGQIAGVADDAVYIFYPDGPEPLPGEPGALKKHYGFDRIESLEKVRDLALKYRERVEGIYHPSIEIIRPEMVGGTP